MPVNYNKKKLLITLIIKNNNKIKIQEVYRFTTLGTAAC